MQIFVLLDKMLLRRLIFCWLTFALGITISCAQDENGYQLPKNIKPIRYNLTVIPNFITDTFSGTVLIEFKVLETSNHITLHAFDLSMPAKKDISVRELNTNRTLTVHSAECVNLEYQYFKISLLETLIKDASYVLTIPNFSKKFDKIRFGFVSGTFTENDGSSHYFSYTQFQPTDARRVFPCFDEPALRAKFNIQLVRPSKQFISASNGRLVSQSEFAPFIDTYEETLDMPTYLVAFTISEMRFSEKLHRYRIIAKPESLCKNEHLYGLNLTAAVVDFMETYTRVPFVLPKLDAVAISGFLGGMENWGLIVYGELFILLNDKTDKAQVVSAVAHEVTHQWFGDLIGLSWWDYLWLSEGLTSYVQSIVIAQVEPSVDSRGRYILSMQSAFQVDMMLDTRPLTQNVQTPKQIISLFDVITYKKGGSLFKMLEAALTAPILQRGLQYYAANMQFKSATPSDLYQNIQKAVDENVSTLPQLLTVADFMASWETVEGYPVVDVRREYGTNIIDLTQTRHILYPLSKNGSWIIPINFATSNNLTFDNTDPDYWITKTQQTIAVPYLNDINWLIANKKATGYYRVNYDETNWNLIIQTLMTNHLDIHVLNRAQLIDDSLNLAKTNHLSYDIAIKLVSYISHEKDPIPWSTYTTNILKLKPMLYHSSYYNIFKEYNFNIMKTVYEYIGFEAKVGESNLLKDLRTIILNMLCELGHQDCLNKSLNKFKQCINTKKDLSKLESYTLCGAIRAGNQEDFDYLFNRITNTYDPAVNIIKGLSCTKNIDNLHKLLQLNDKIAMDEMIEIVMDSGPEGLQTTINFVIQNFEIINARFERKVEFLLRRICQSISSYYQLKELKQAINDRKDAQLFAKLFAITEDNIAWKKRNLQKVAEKFNIYGGIL